MSRTAIIYFSAGGNTAKAARAMAAAVGAELAEGKVFTRLKIGTAADWIRGLEL